MCTRHLYWIFTGPIFAVYAKIPVEYHKACNKVGKYETSIKKFFIKKKNFLRQYWNLAQ